MISVPKDIIVEELTTLEEWDTISQSWDDLLIRYPEASILNSHAYLRGLYTKFLNRHSGKLAILLLKDETGKLLGAAPMFRSKRWMTGFPIQVIAFFYQPFITDRIQCLLPDRRDGQLHAIFRYLKDHGDNWDMLELHEQSVDREFESIINSVFCTTRDYSLNLVYPSVGPYLETDFGRYGWKKYLLTRSRKHRKNWRYLQNKISNKGTVTVTRHTGEEDLTPAVTEYQQLEQKSRKKGGQATLSTETWEFFLELATTLRPKGNMHFVFLRLDGQPIAGAIGMSLYDRYVGLKIIFDQNFSPLSPGFLICGYEIKWAIENGISEFDFMTGAVEHKMAWTDSHRKLCTLRFVKKDIYMGLFYLVKFRIVPVLRKILAKFGMKISPASIFAYDNLIATGNFDIAALRLDDHNQPPIKRN